MDYLADQQFPVQMVSIVGNELKMVERVTGRLTYPRVALSGALSGMWFGLFVGVMLSFFSTTPGYFSIVTSVLMGAAFFMLFGIVTYAMQRGKRDFTSTSQVVATNYDVVVSFEAAGEARRLLHQLPMTPHDASGAAAGGYAQHDYGAAATRSSPHRSSPGAGPCAAAPRGLERSVRPEDTGDRRRAGRAVPGRYSPSRRAPQAHAPTAAGTRKRRPPGRPGLRGDVIRTSRTAARSTASGSRTATSPRRTRTASSTDSGGSDSGRTESSKQGESRMPGHPGPSLLAVALTSF